MNTKETIVQSFVKKYNRVSALCFMKIDNGIIKDMKALPYLCCLNLGNPIRDFFVFTVAPVQMEIRLLLPILKKNPNIIFFLRFVSVTTHTTQATW